VGSGDGSGGNKVLWVDRRVGLKVALEILASEVMEGLTRVIAGSGFLNVDRPALSTEECCLNRLLLFVNVHHRTTN
jgi:hypothetical protein